MADNYDPSDEYGGNDDAEGNDLFVEGGIRDDVS
jgi:hypothetical protein